QAGAERRRTPEGCRRGPSSPVGGDAAPLVPPPRRDPEQRARRGAARRLPAGTYTGRPGQAGRARETGRGCQADRGTEARRGRQAGGRRPDHGTSGTGQADRVRSERSEERRVGKEWRCRWGWGRGANESTAV